MREHKRHHVAIALSIGAVITFSGCGKAGETLSQRGAEAILERESGQKVDIDAGGQRVRVESDEGTFEMGGGMPEQWPTDLPLPPDFVPNGGMHGNDGESITVVASGTTSMSVGDVQTFYEAGMASWNKVTSSRISGESESVALVFEDGDRQFAVTATDAGEHRELGLTYIVDPDE